MMKDARMMGRTVLGVLVAGLLLATCGCESEDTDSDITPTRFHMERDLLSYSSVDTFTWDTTLVQPTATVRIKDFSHGDATLRIYDANGTQILNSHLFTDDHTIYVGGNDFQVSKTTGRGTPGRWRVEMGYNDFSGEITLTIE